MNKFTRISESEWWRIAQECEWATFFHTPLWKEMIVRSFPMVTDATVSVQLASGGQAVLPLLQARVLKGLFLSTFSSFAGCYGGIIADRSVLHEEEEFIYQGILKRRTVDAWIVDNPLKPLGHLPSIYQENADFTQILHLSEDFTAVFGGFSKGHRGNTTKGRRLGVTTQIGTSIEDYQKYFDIYCQALERWGENATNKYPWSLFSNGCRLASAFPENIRLWLAVLNGQVVSGAWVFYWGRHVVYWHAATDHTYIDYCPANVLLADVIEHACRSGYAYFDFNPSGGHESVAAFKKRFGAEKYMISRWSYANPKAHMILRAKNKILGFYKS